MLANVCAVSKILIKLRTMNALRSILGPFLGIGSGTERQGIASSRTKSPIEVQSALLLLHHLTWPLVCNCEPPRPYEALAGISLLRPCTGRSLKRLRLVWGLSMSEAVLFARYLAAIAFPMGRILCGVPERHEPQGLFFLFAMSFL